MDLGSRVLTTGYLEAMKETIRSRVKGFFKPFLSHLEFNDGVPDGVLGEEGARLGI